MLALQVVAYRWRALPLAMVLALATPATIPALAQTDPGGGGAPGDPVGSRAVPTLLYYAGLHAYYNGDFRDALKTFQSNVRGSIKNGQNRWIDSICYHTMVGECLYQMGQMPEALAQYDVALQLYIANNEFLIPCKFSPSIRPASVAAVKPVPWGQPKRNLRVGQFPDSVLISQGRIDQTSVVQQGGVVQQAVLFPINPQEIIRCTALAMHRRRELLGPASMYDTINLQMIATLTRRPVQPNHWSEAWIDALLGLAYSAGNKFDQAETVLKRAIVTGGEYDHPLTATVLVELGRISLIRGDYQQALQYFDEASYSAVYFQDAINLEEAFRGALQAHLMANRQGNFVPAVPTADWARASKYRHLQAAVLVLAAEHACTQNNSKEAQRLLDLARASIGRADLGNARLGARLQFVQAMAAYQAGNMGPGTTALNQALAFYAKGSIWLFHMAVADARVASGALSERAAMDVFAEVLRDPTAHDWLVDPLEALAAQSQPHSRFFERWFDVAMKRNEHERALEIADLARRHRFLSSLELGGRLLSLKWVLEGPAEMLGQQATLQRQDLLARYPQYAELSKQARDARDALRQTPLAPDDNNAARQLSIQLGELGNLAQQQEKLIRQMAVRREPADTIFPPVRTTQEVRQALPDGHALLTFFDSGQSTYGFLLTNDKYANWRLPPTANVQKALATLLRDMGNYDGNKELRLAELTSEAWQSSSRELLDLLTKDSKAELPYDFTELVIVPDGLTWYVPFEGLQTSAGTGGTLISQVRVRYAPTVGLAVLDPRPRRQGGVRGIVLGKLFPTDSDETLAAALADCQHSLPGSTPLRGPLPAPAGVFGALLDTLVVLADIPATNGAYDWMPIPTERSSQGNTLADWMRLPWNKAEYVLLPGFHTAAEASLRKPNSLGGNEVFLSACGLMASGARTVLLSRWRPGGQTSRDLVREFAQELPYTTAADAWQRSVLVAKEQPLNIPYEPRIRIDSADESPLANHPFLWSGFLVLDTGTAPADDSDPAEDIIKIKPNEQVKADQPE